MPGAKRFHLAHKLAIVALGAATLAIANAGQLPAQAAYGPPPPPPNAPGGYGAVVTSVTIGPAGGVIGPVRAGACEVVLTVPPGTFTTQVQITITAPGVRGIGHGGHPGYRPVCGVGVLVQVNGKAYTGNFAHSLTLDISGPGISSRDRVGEWNGTEFKFVSAAEAGDTIRIRFLGSEDFAVFAPTGARFAGQRTGSTRQGHVTAVFRGNRAAETLVLTSVFLTPAGRSPAGIGVLSREWLGASSR